MVPTTEVIWPNADWPASRSTTDGLENDGVLVRLLDGRHVVAEICRNLFPRMQGVFGRSDGWQCVKGWLAHRTLPIGQGFLSPNGSLHCPRKALQKAAFDGKVRKRLQCCALPLELTRQGVPLCPWVTSKSPNWSSFMKSKTPISAILALPLLLLVSATSLTR